MRYKILICLLLVSSWAQANLLISPTRVIFSGNERAEKVVVINQGTSSATYRIDLVGNLQTASGDYHRLDLKKDNITGIFLANDMIRYSPRQVTLKPGEKQTIRLSLRKPDGLASGEYRAHLSFTQLPNAIEIEKDSKAAKMQVFMLTSFTIPVQVWQGKAKVDAKIERAQLVLQPLPDKPKVKQWVMQIDLTRKGSFSSVGKLNIYWKESVNDSYQLLKFLDNATLYRELDARTIQVGLDAEDVKQGYYMVEYEAAKIYEQRIFDRYEFQY